MAPYSIRDAIAHRRRANSTRGKRSILTAAASLAVALLCASCVGGSAPADDVVQLGTVSAKDLKEISGMAASRRYPGILWVHNDGSKRRLFALSTNGQLIATFKLDFKVEDLEDIAIGPGPKGQPPQLYLGDIGGNDRRRRVVQIIRLPEPELPAGLEAKEVINLHSSERFELRYPDGGHDAEALLVDPISGDILVVTKQHRRARVFMAPASQLRGDTELTMTRVADIAVPSVSAGDISPDGRLIILRSEGVAVLWERGREESIFNIWNRPPQRAAVVGPPEEPNGEAIAWSPTGDGYYTLSEGKKQAVYYFPWPQHRAGPSGAGDGS